MNNEVSCSTCTFLKKGKCTLLNEIINYNLNDQMDDIDEAINSAKVADEARTLIRKELGSILDSVIEERLIEGIEYIVRSFYPRTRLNQDIDDPEILSYQNFNCSEYK